MLLELSKNQSSNKDSARTTNPTLIKAHVNLKSWLSISKSSTYRAGWNGGGTVAPKSVDMSVLAEKLSLGAACRCCMKLV